MGPCFFHIDLDAFFASVECLDHPEYRGRPLIVGYPGPRSVASTCSYEARAYGVHSAMPMTTALKLCPDAICVWGNHRRYSEKSKEVMSIISSFAPGFLQVSVDEAFLDLTGMERIYPLPGKAARVLKERIREETGLTASVGVAPSRFLAKLASDFHKPDGLTVVPPGKEIEFVDAVGLKKLWGVGKSTLDTLRRKGITSVGTLRSFSLEDLVSLFGESSGKYLFSVSRGIDPGIYRGETKSRSISEERTYVTDLYSMDVIRTEVLSMSQSIMFRALDTSCVGRTVTVKLRSPDFTTVSASETPLLSLSSSSDVAECAMRLIEKRYDNRGLRLLGISLSGLYDAKDPEQKELWGEKKEKLRELEKTILSLSKDGKTVLRASNLHTGEDK